MENFYESLAALLKTDERFLSTEGDLLRNAVYEAANNMDVKLLHLLLSNETTKTKFFKKVDDISVFDKTAFGWAINSKQFLPDSYTRFKDKIGLADGNGDLLISQGSVELVFPYKDGILEGNQKRKDDKRTEVFYNENLAPDEIDKLLSAKVFVNAAKYDKEGVHPINAFTGTDNLIIKGNNLLVMNSLLKRFEGCVDCLFADLPYYFTKNKTKSTDAFKYNTNFRLSTWLAFCKSRFAVAKRLIANSGFLVITIGTDGYCYLKVLLDEIFDVSHSPENYVGTITWRKTDNQSNVGEFANVVDYILIYRKSKNAHLGRLSLSAKAQKEYSYSDKKGKYRRANLLDRTRGTYMYDIKTPGGDVLHGPWMIEYSEYQKLEKTDGIHWPEKGYQIPYGKIYLKDSLEKGQIPSDLWDNSYGTNQRGADEIKALFGERAFPFAKPELLMMNILSMCSHKGGWFLTSALGVGLRVLLRIKWSASILVLNRWIILKNSQLND